MYDYMKALQRQFETDSKSAQDLNDEINRAHKELSSRLAKEDRKLLLRLVDLEDNLQSVATLHSFTCGYRLACGIHRELAEEPMYSFAKEEEERACRRAQDQGESDSADANDKTLQGGEHKWQSADHPATEWYASVTMADGKAVSWSATKKTANPSSATSTPTPKRN